MLTPCFLNPCQNQGTCITLLPKFFLPIPSDDTQQTINQTNPHPYSELDLSSLLADSLKSESFILKCVCSPGFIGQYCEEKEIVVEDGCQPGSGSDEGCSDGNVCIGDEVNGFKCVAEKCVEEGNVIV